MSARYYLEEYEHKAGNYGGHKGTSSFCHITLPKPVYLQVAEALISSISVSKGGDGSDYQVGLNFTFPNHLFNGKPDPLMQASRPATDSKGHTYKSGHLFMNNEVRSRFNAWYGSVAGGRRGLGFNSSYFYASDKGSISTSTFFKTASGLKHFMAALQHDTGFSIALDELPKQLATPLRDGVTHPVEPVAAAGAGDALMLSSLL